MRYYHRRFLFWTAVVVLFLAACDGNDVVTPTTMQPALTANPGPTRDLPATADISTPVLESTSVTPAVAPGSGTADIQSGSVLTDDDFLPIDQILSEIDNDVCQNAFETKAELEALIAEGADLAELEAAVDELIEELENCPTPTPE